MKHAFYLRQTIYLSVNYRDENLWYDRSMNFDLVLVLYKMNFRFHFL